MRKDNNLEEADYGIVLYLMKPFQLRTFRSIMIMNNQSKMIRKVCVRLGRPSLPKGL